MTNYSPLPSSVLPDPATNGADMITIGNTTGRDACIFSVMETDTVRFIRSWAAAPLTVASIVPSGEALARIMTGCLSPAAAPVLELGPGTGVFTRAILRSGVAEKDLTLLEYGSDFARLLQYRFPRARVLWMDASRLNTLQVPEAFGAVVSGLPMLSMTPKKVTAVLSGAFAKMRPGGRFIQFTYGPRCPVPQPILDSLGLDAFQEGRALLNFPPANVYRFTRRCETASP